MEQGWTWLDAFQAGQSHTPSRPTFDLMRLCSVSHWEPLETLS